ncbi:MAG: type II secretion system F family protein [bacterium]
MRQFIVITDNFGVKLSLGHSKEDVLRDESVRFCLRNPFYNDRPLSDKEAANFFESLMYLFKSSGTALKSLKFLEDRYNKTKTKFRYKNAARNFINAVITRLIADSYKKRLHAAASLRRDLEKGFSLTEGIKKLNFDDIAVGIISSAEKTGDLTSALGKTHNYYETKNKFKKGFIKEISYPLFLMLTSFGVFIVFIFYVIPQFAKFFKGIPNIPAQTTSIINLFLNLKHWFLLYSSGTGIILACLIGVWFTDYKGARTKIYEFIAGLPGIGYFFRFSNLKWYLYEFSILISSGQTFQYTVQYLDDHTQNEFFKNKFRIINLYLSQGQTVTESLNASDLLRPEDLDRVASGEIAGNLDEVFMILSKEYEEITELQIKVINKIINYGALFLIAAFIILIFTGIYLPMIKAMVSLSGGA